jgi:hypothetical protein
VKQDLVKVTERSGEVAGPLAFMPRVLKPAQKMLGRRRLNHDLAKWLGAAKSFQLNGAPPGGKAYQQLYRQCCDAIKRHAVIWRVPVETIAVEFPALYSLEKLAHPERAPKTRGPRVPGGILLAVVVLFLAALLGMATGVYQVVQKAIAR